MATLTVSLDSSISHHIKLDDAIRFLLVNSRLFINPSI
ncbi:hypothetical protein VHA_002330 [Grimontia hollisae CIP 101886]|uniref:Uncharacterized protein n=1 Tax=Grimontia hollisae CIP 101886 TaxID=675812 RepID=D0I8Z3_GRIHO|nr:hypothetical protein VHA_002330 [Grimontia hollisae CIP 101886]